MLGAHEVGMLRALAERGIEPDMVLGTSVGAINGAFFAADPTLAGVERLTELWRESNWSERSAGARRCAGSPRWRAAALIWSRCPRCASGWLRCCRCGGWRSSECRSSAWPRRSSAPPSTGSTRGPLADVVLASCAVPGILPPVPIDGEHFIDGGIVNSIPVSRAVTLGARKIYVLQVGRLEQSLKPPRRPWEVGLVAFEVARRHRFAHDLHNLPEGIELHVLPTGGSAAPAYNDLSGQLRVGRMIRTVQRQIDSAYEASLRYLAQR